MVIGFGIMSFSLTSSQIVTELDNNKLSVIIQKLRRFSVPQDQVKMPVAVVTGSNKGIGLAVVRRLCQEFQGEVYLTSRWEVVFLVTSR